MVNQPLCEPLSLGFEGEEWHHTICALTIPIPGTERVILVTPEGNKYTLQRDISHTSFALITNDHWEQFDDLLMVAAFIRNFLDTYDVQEK